MKIAIYSRKSKFTGKGESTQNQIKMCKEYALSHFDVKEFLIYEDEGFSGGSTDRPKYRKMMVDASNGKFDVLMCYRLDRISRNIADFSDIIEILQDNGIAFVSLREQFDTSTPMGRAMMYIASVFAQLERETAAERIRDNMRSLARSGRWLGGNTPTGYESEPIAYIDSNMKEKKMYKLTQIDEELNTVKLLFNKYLEYGSLTRVHVYTLQNKIKTKRGNDFHRYSIKNILTNPVYAKASKEVYHYFNSNGAQICNNEDEFDNVHGMMVYNKNLVKKGTSVKTKDTSEWIVAIGKHKGIIEGKDWVRVQQMINRNKSKAPRQSTSTAALLSGLLRCANCGSFMMVKYGQRKQNSNERHHYYVCNMKDKSRKKRCNIQNLIGEKTDKYVLDKLKETISTGFLKSLDERKKKVDDIEVKNKKILKKINENKRSIDNLLKQLAKNDNDNVAKYIFDEIDKLDKENSQLEKKLEDDNSELQKINIDLFKASALKFIEIIDNVDKDRQNNLIKSIVKKIHWDGVKLDIELLDVSE